MNWSQAPASRLRIVAGLKVSRVISSRLMTRGFGISSLAVSGNVLSRGKFRPKRRPAEPIFGKLRSFEVPSMVRDIADAGSRSAGISRRGSAGSSVSCRFFSRSSVRMFTSCPSADETAAVGTTASS